MLKSINTFVLLLAALFQPTVLAQDASVGNPRELEEVVVTGVLPGPPLWKITNGEHALWILPLVNLYPKDMEWESDRVAKLIADSQEFIAIPYATNVTYTSNPLTAIRLIGTYNKTTHLQNGETLADVLPPDSYQRFVKLKTRYFKYDKAIDKLTPREAGTKMQKEILDAENLEQLSYANPSSPEVIMDSVYKWLKRNKSIRRTSTSHVVFDKLKFSELKKQKEDMIAAVSTDRHREFEVACLTAKIAYFENDVESAKKRANAWAQGDPDELIRHGAALKNDAALQSLRGPCRMQMASDDATAMEKISQEKWLAAAESALARNETTFAVLGINDILAPDGLVAMLQMKGYVVEVSR
jgi:hypothetical protein